MQIIIESQYIGCARYWSLLVQSEHIVLDQHEHYVKRSYRNRAHILGANGLLKLSVPLEHGKQQRSILKDVRISYQENWQKNHWQSLVSAYRRSPFFEYYEDNFRKLYQTEYEFLFEYNYAYLVQIAKLLNVNLFVSFSVNYQPKSVFQGLDCRNKFLPQQTLSLDFPKYTQVFSDRFDFIPDLCVLDVLFNLGTRSVEYLKGIKS